MPDTDPRVPQAARIETAARALDYLAPGIRADDELTRGYVNELWEVIREFVAVDTRDAEIARLEGSNLMLTVAIERFLDSIPNYLSGYCRAEVSQMRAALADAKEHHQL